MAKRPSPKIVLKRIDSIKIPRGYDPADAATIEAIREDLVYEDGQILSSLHILPDGTLLDGRQRLEAARKAGDALIVCRIWPKATNRKTFRLRANALRKPTTSSDTSKARVEIRQAYADKGEVAPVARTAKLTGVTKRTIRQDRQSRSGFDDRENEILDGGKVGKKARVKLAREVESLTPAYRRRAIEQAADEARKKKPGRPKAKPDGTIIDGEGRPLPADVEVREAFTDRPLWDAIADVLVALEAKLSTLSQRVEGTRSRRLVRLRDQLKGAAAELRGSAPHSPCPYCKGATELCDDCRYCEGSGWVGKQVYDAAEDSLKAWGEGAVVAKGGKLVPLARVTS